MERQMKRKCGVCSLCCYVLDIGEPINSPAFEWCQHCRPGKGGCSIYSARPEGCRKFECEWLRNQFDMPDYWFPKRSHMVVRWLDNFGRLVLTVNVDPRYPDSWRKEPYRSDLRRVALFGLKTRGTKYATRVVVGEKQFIVLPDHEVELTTEQDNFGFFVPTGPDQFEWVATARQETTL
jgi:hypothetical protein